MTDIDPSSSQIDCFSKFIWVAKLTSKSKGDLVPALEKLLSKSGGFEKIQVDGKIMMIIFMQHYFHMPFITGELNYLRPILKEKGTFLLTKRRGTHVNVVDASIGVIKRKLYAMMRLKKTSHWSQLLDQVVDLVNR